MSAMLWQPARFRTPSDGCDVNRGRVVRSVSSDGQLTIVLHDARKPKTNALLPTDRWRITIAKAPAWLRFQPARAKPVGGPTGAGDASQPIDHIAGLAAPRAGGIRRGARRYSVLLLAICGLVILVDTYWKARCCCCNLRVRLNARTIGQASGDCTMRSSDMEQSLNHTSIPRA